MQLASSSGERFDRSDATAISHPCCPAADPNHVVQFYEDDAFLADTVADYCAPALAAGDPVLIIASEAHSTAITSRLASRGFDVAAARRRGQIVLRDARALLSTFMADALPDGPQFQTVIGGLIDQFGHPSDRASVRAYGEMVDLLWKDGNIEGAIRLEEMWNELAATHSFSLLCAYAMSNFDNEAHTPHFHEICRQHAHVAPTESYLRADDAARMLEISRLQQRAQSLEAEIEHRKELERRLREALAQRQQAEEALRQSERELTEFLENAAESIHWVGPEGIVLWANRAELALLGYTRGEYVGRHIAAFHDDPAVAEDMLARLTRGETLTDFEATMRCKDGSSRHVVVNSNAIWRDGKLVHTGCFTRDVTERKRAADQRERALERERADAEAASRAKSQFMAIMSHELRTPLNAIGGYAELIEMGIRGPVTDAQREDVARIQKSQRRLLSLVNEVLTYTRIETGAVQYEASEVSIADVIAEAEPVVRPQLLAKGLEFIVAPCSATAKARADREKLGQVLINLISNAIKFTARGGQVMVGCEVGECGGDRFVKVRVSDTGVGIPANKLDAVFEPFVQVNTGLTRPHEGTGLGLTISRDLARGMRGDLTVESTLGAGSTFTVTLPAV